MTTRAEAIAAMRAAREALVVVGGPGGVLLVQLGDGTALLLGPGADDVQGPMTVDAAVALLMPASSSSAPHERRIEK